MSTTHDVLSTAVGTEAVRRIRLQDPEWSTTFSPASHIVASRTWPQPDWVIVDETLGTMLAAEFKPPAQTKREYLTGLGQAVAYTRDFSYSALVVPDYADDGYRIGDHIESVLAQQIYDSAPVALITYDPATLSQSNAAFALPRGFSPRSTPVATTAALSESLFAKWRDASADELGRYLGHLYDEGRAATALAGTIRDRAFAKLWSEMTSGQTRNWQGTARSLNVAHQVAWSKNYRNFASHIGWIHADGALTEDGLQAAQVVHRYGGSSQVFLDLIARHLLTNGRHLVLINAISRFQDGSSVGTQEQVWLDGTEDFLEKQGLLKRNPGRHQAAVQNVSRGFLKSEKTLWRNLQLIVPRGGRAFHADRGLIFNWERITSLVA